MQAVIEPHKNINVFLYDSIEFLVNLYLPGTAVRVLELILSNVRIKHREKQFYNPDAAG